jgi:HK97 family phage major capsid protein
MYEDPCPHGYVPASCAECRRGAQRDALPGSSALIEHYDDQHHGKTRAQLDARRAQCIERAAELGGYAHPSQAQRAEFDSLTAETIVLDGLIKADDVKIRRAQIENVRRAAMDPANCEGPAGWPEGTPGAPPLVKDRGRVETGRDVVQRHGSDPWHGEAGPLRQESAAGYIARAHSAIEAQQERLGPGAELLARHLAESQDYGGGLVSTKTRDEVERSAQLILAASSPFYESAFRHILRDPESFRSGAGALLWTDEERDAYTQVGYAYRAAFAESAGSSGGYLLPFVLDPSVIYSNAGTASPWRRISRHVTTTSNTWNGVVSAGVTAQWLAEGAVAADATPTFTNLVLAPFKMAAWCFGSLEVIGDTNLSEQVPQMIDEGRGRLEATAFAVGTGSGQPTGAVTGATVDGSTGLVSVANAVSVFSLHQNLPARFRSGDQARPYFVANIAIIDALRGVAPFAAATTSIVNDATDDGVPEIFGIDLLESSDMDAVNTTGGHKNLIFGDFGSYVICDRLGSTLIFEPLYFDQATARPTGQQGWFVYSRVDAKPAVATALRVHNNV